VQQLRLAYCLVSVFSLATDIEVPFLPENFTEGLPNKGYSTWEESKQYELSAAKRISNALIYSIQRITSIAGSTAV